MGVKKELIEIKGKWIWMMEYCKATGIPAAESWAWREAEKAYEKK